MRTDRTYVCVSCRIRTWPVRRCPACGETTSLGDLEQDALSAIEARTPRRRGGGAGPLVLMIGGTIGVIGSALLFGSGRVGMAEAGVGASIVSILVGALRAPKPEKITTPYQVLASPVVRDSASRETAIGRVRATRTITAPLSGEPCVAWRLVAESVPMPLDDAKAIGFTVVGTHGVEHEIDASVATIDLALSSAAPRALGTIGGELARWLAARGVVASDTLLVREAVLRDGDVVQVVGTSRTEAKAAGYRGHDTREVLADLPGSPLVVRSPVPENDAPATIA